MTQQSTVHWARATKLCNLYEYINTEPASSSTIKQVSFSSSKESLLFLYLSTVCSTGWNADLYRLPSRRWCCPPWISAADYITGKWSVELEAEIRTDFVQQTTTKTSCRAHLFRLLLLLCDLPPKHESKESAKCRVRHAVSQTSSTKASACRQRTAAPPYAAAIGYCIQNEWRDDGYWRSREQKRRHCMLLISGLHCTM